MTYGERREPTSCPLTCTPIPKYTQHTQKSINMASEVGQQVKALAAKTDLTSVPRMHVVGENPPLPPQVE